MRFFNKDLNTFKVPLISFGIFILIGLIVWGFRHVMYFYLFLGIGFLDFSSRVLIQLYPNSRQIFRLSLQLILGSFLLFWLGLGLKGDAINFQFPEIFFDAYAGVITGALIQLIVARLILPFFLGNGFCSRACWSGFFFEMTNVKIKGKSKIKPRSSLLAWSYLVFLICLTFIVAQVWINPANDFMVKRWWIIGENLFIVSIGFVLTFFIGSRAYCRMLCPFITISGLIAPFSLFKITPVKVDQCNGCQLCSKKCPMLIEVHSFVKQNKRINDSTCILCERCISACNKDVLKLTTKVSVIKNECKKDIF